jgi:hypothetical protein
MSVIYSENSTHRTNIANAERARQAAVVPGASQSAVTAAELSFYRTVLTSALQNNCDASTFTTALKALGVNS